jgi:hypothetical protein
MIIQTDEYSLSSSTMSWSWVENKWMLASGAAAEEEDELSFSSFSFSDLLPGFSPAAIMDDDDDTQGQEQEAEAEELSLISLPLSVLLNLNTNNCDCDDEVESDNLSVGSGGTDIPAIIHALQEEEEEEEEDNEKHTADWAYFDEGPNVIRLIAEDTAGAGAEYVPDTDTDGATSRAREEDDLLHIDASSSWMRRYHQLKVSESARGPFLLSRNICV